MAAMVDELGGLLTGFSGYCDPNAHGVLRPAGEDVGVELDCSPGPPGRRDIQASRSLLYSGCTANADRRVGPPLMAIRAFANVDGECASYSAASRGVRLDCGHKFISQ